MSKIIIACGGTGGHLAPGIAVAEVLQGRGHECVLLISRKQVDSKLVEKYPHLTFERTPGRAFAGGLRARIGSFVCLIQGFLFSRKLIRERQPDFVFLFGGFLSVGLCLAARIAGVAVALHEANHHPGRSIRLIKRFATRLYLPDGVCLRGVSPERVCYYGYPVRRDIKHCLRGDACERLGIEVPDKLLVVIGGSQGAAALNDWVMRDFERMAVLGISVYCVTGMGNLPAQVIRQRSQRGELVTATFVPFSDSMGEVISAADLVVSRAGAGSIAEIIRCRAPSILIPYPYAANDHQSANALMHVEKGGGVMMKQAAIPGLTDEVIRMIFDDELLANLRSSLGGMEGFDSSERIADDIEMLCLERASHRNEKLEPSI